MPSRKLTHVRASVKTNIVNTNVYSVECPFLAGMVTAIDSRCLGADASALLLSTRDVTHIVDNIDTVSTAHSSSLARERPMFAALRRIWSARLHFH